MRIPNLFSSNYIHHKKCTILKPQQFNLSTRSKPSKKLKSHKKPLSNKHSSKQQSSPSLLQTIKNIVSSGNAKEEEVEDPSFSFSKHAGFNASKTQLCTPTVCQNAQGMKDSEHVNRVVRKVTEILRSENADLTVEKRLDEMGVLLSNEIVESVLKNCYKVGHLAHRFFNWVKLQDGFKHGTETYNAMINIAGEHGDFGLVEKLVKEIDDGSCLKNVKTWTILISRYGKVKKKIGKVLSVFEEMRRSGCELDSFVYETVIKALVNAEKGELALEFYKEMVSKGMEVVDVKLYDLLMCCLSRSGNVAAAREIGNDLIKSNRVSESKGYTRILRSFCTSGRIYEAQALLEENERNNVEVDLNAHEILLQGFCRAGRVDEAMKIVDNMKQNTVLDSKIYGFLVDGLLRSGNISKALELLYKMMESKCVPMVSTYTQIIQHLFRSDNYKIACEIYDEMVENGIKPDVVAITAMIAGHVRNNRNNEAFELFERMKKEGIIPNWKAYSIFIKELCKAFKPNEALQLLNDMVASKLDVTQNLFGLVISSYLRKGDVEKANIVKEMSKSFKFGNSLENKQVHDSINDEPIRSFVKEDSKPMHTEKGYNDSDFKILCRILSSTDFNLIEKDLEMSNIQCTPELVVAILNSCRKNGHNALKFFAWVGKRSRYRHTTDTYNLAIKISGCAKDFKHMRQLYQEMRRSRCLVTPNTWTIMIIQYGQAGLTELALKTYRDMRYDGFRPNASTYKYLVVFLCRKKGQKLEEAIKIFQEMMDVGFLPDKETVFIYLSSLCESKKLADAKKCVKSLFKNGFTKQVGYLLLVKSACRAEELEEAFIIIKEMENDGCIIDQFVYGSVVHALLRKGRLNEALYKVEEMEKAGISQSVHMQTSFIVHYCKEKQIEKALEIFKSISVPTLVTYSAMIRGYMNMEMVSDAWDIFQELKTDGPFPDFETYSMFISCLCRIGKSEDGLQLINEMLEKGIIPSAVNFRTVFHGLNREGKQSLAHLALETKSNLKRQRMFSM